MPHDRARNSCPASRDPSTQLSLRVRAEQNHPAVRLNGAEAEDPGQERSDLARREIRHSNDRAALEVLLRVPPLDRRGTPLDAEPDRKSTRLNSSHRTSSY